MGKIGVRVVLLALVLMTGACSSILGTGSKEETRVYLLEGGPDFAVAARRLDPGGPSLILATPEAAPGFTSSRMIYVETPYRLDAYAYHRWADAPARMMEPLLLQALESAGLFSSVSTSGGRVRSDLRMDTEILRLQQTFKGERSSVDLAIRITLTDLGTREVLTSRVLTVDEPVKEAGPYGGVLAVNRAVDRLLEDLLRYLEQALKKGR